MHIKGAIDWVTGTTHVEPGGLWMIQSHVWLHKPKGSDVNACESVLVMNDKEQHGANAGTLSFNSMQNNRWHFYALEFEQSRLDSNR